MWEYPVISFSLGAIKIIHGTLPSTHNSGIISKGRKTAET
jgi:hypothetical protein